MRARNIKPGLCKNEELAELGPWARIVFSCLPMMADREGKLEDRPKRIKAEILPYDDIDIEPVLDALHHRGFIRRYQADGGRYILITNFGKHQNPHPREAAYGYPEPPEITEETQKPCNYKASHEINGLVPLLPLNPIPSFPSIPSLPPIVPQPEPCKLKANPKPAVRPSGSLTETQQQKFDEFWNAYPKKRSKGQAEITWGKIKPSSDLHAKIMASLERQRQCDDWTRESGRFIPYPSTWLNAKGWEDEPDADPGLASAETDPERARILAQYRKPVH